MLSASVLLLLLSFVVVVGVDSVGVVGVVVGIVVAVIVVVIAFLCIGVVCRSRPCYCCC